MNPESKHFLECIFNTRRRTLFNLYAFSYTDSFQKAIPSVQIPTLILQNVLVKNMLNEY